MNITIIRLLLTVNMPVYAVTHNEFHTMSMTICDEQYLYTDVSLCGLAPGTHVFVFVRLCCFFMCEYTSFNQIVTLSQSV